MSDISARRMAIANGLFGRWNDIPWKQASANVQEEFLDWAQEIEIWLDAETEDGARRTIEMHRDYRNFQRKTKAIAKNRKDAA